MASDLVMMYQKEVEDGLSLVKSQKIPAGDWKAAEEHLKQCAQTLMLMEQKARSAGNSQKRDTTMVAVNSLRKEIDMLLDDVRRSSLLNRSRIGSDDDPESGRLLDPDEEEREILTKSQVSLENSRRALGDMHQVGLGIQNELSQQGETIHSVHGKVKHTTSLAGEGRNILRNVERAEMRNKLCAYGAVGAVFIGIVVAIYWILFRT
jgi:hypothetical protein